MTRMLLAAAALGAAAFTAAPATAGIGVSCPDKDVVSCWVERIEEFCVPNGDLEDDCRWPPDWWPGS